MRAGGNQRGARTISLALVAGLIAFETILALSAGAVGIPGLFLIRLAKGSGGAEAPQPATASEGGESVIAKLEAANEPSHQTPVAAKPLSPVAPAGEPRLDGLADIPLTPWDRDEAKPDKPTAFAANSAGREVLPWDAVEPVPYPTGDSRRRAGRRHRFTPGRGAGSAARARRADRASRQRRGRNLGQGQGDRDQGRGARPAALSFRVLARAAGGHEGAAGGRRL